MSAYQVNKSLVVKWLITIIAPICIMLTPVSGGYTSEIRLFLAVTVCAVFLMAFEIICTMMISLLLPGTYLLLNLSPASVVFSGWLTSTPYMLVGAFIFANVLDESNFLKRLTYWCMIKLGGSYRRMLFALMTTGIVLTFIANSASTMIMIVFCYAVCKALDIGQTRDAAIITCVGASSVMIAGLAIYVPLHISLIQGGMNAVGLTWSVSYVEYLIQNWPQFIYAYLLVFVWAIIFKPISPTLAQRGKEYFKEEYASCGKMDAKEKKAIAFAVIIMIFLVGGPLIGLDAAWTFALLPVIAYLPFMNIGSQSAIRNVNFELIFFVMGCLSMGSVSTNMGIGNLVSQLLSPILSGLNSYFVIMAVYVLGILANFILTPLAYMAAFSGPIADVAINLGVNPVGAIYALLSSTEQILLPYEYPAYMMFMAFGMVKLTDFMKLFSIRMLLALVFTAAIMIPYWMLIGIV